MATNRRVILAVDDDEIQRYAVSKMLGLGGFEVLLAEDGSTAIRLATENKPHLILLDINLPDVNGYEVCRRLRKTAETASIPVVFYTAVSATANAKAEAEAAGAKAFLTYPVEENQLLAVIRGSMAKVSTGR